MITEKKTVYTIGDSHAWHAWLHVPGVIWKNVGPMTMYSFGIDKPIVTDGIPLSGIVCFSWGEIDCRCHVYNHPPWDECIDKLVENYFEAIKVNIEGRDPKNIWVYNIVPPPWRDGNSSAENAAFPFLGTNEERVSFTKRMNQRLREGPYLFVDLYDRYADKDGFLKMELSDQHVHVADPKPLEEFVNDHA